jgi:hypothetical protein
LCAKNKSVARGLKGSLWVIESRRASGPARQVLLNNQTRLAYSRGFRVGHFRHGGERSINSG